MTKTLEEKAAQTSEQQDRVTTIVPENINMSHTLAVGSGYYRKDYCNKPFDSEYGILNFISSNVTRSSIKANQYDLLYKQREELIAKLVLAAKEDRAALVAQMKPLKAKLTRAKDGPGFVGRVHVDGVKKADNIAGRGFLALDIDNGDERTLTVLLMRLDAAGLSYIVYSTFSHRPGIKYRYRVVVILSRELTDRKQYNAVIRTFAAQIDNTEGGTWFDPTTFEWGRMNYLPRYCSDIEPEIHIWDIGNALDVDAVLAEVDIDNLPRFGADDIPIDSLDNGKWTHPTKSGFAPLQILYELHPDYRDFIDEHISDKYIDTGHGTHLYIDGSSGELKPFEDGACAYYFGGSDPAGVDENGQRHRVTVYDIALKHKFNGDRDQLHSWISKLPGYAAASARVAFTEFDEIEDDPEPGREKPTLPPCYEVIDGKTFEVKELKTETKYIPVCSTRMIISERFRNITDGTEGLTVCWKETERTRRLQRSRGAFMDSKRIIEFAEYGFPVHSDNARGVSKYLSHYEVHNIKAIPVKNVSNQMGWVKDGFLLGENFIGSGEPLQFVARDAGDSQTAKGFHKKGTIEGQLTLLKAITSHPKVKMMVWAGLASPLVGLWGLNNFIAEATGETSQGKTIALQVAASQYGCPDERKPGFFKSWFGTRVSIERRAATLGNLPLFLDDTKKADPRILSSVIYQFCSGQGKGRGSIKGTQRSENWQSILLSSGEQKITSFTKDGGTVGRVLSLTGSPWGDGVGAQDVQRIAREVNCQLS